MLGKLISSNRNQNTFCENSLNIKIIENNSNQ